MSKTGVKRTEETRNQVHNIIEKIFRNAFFIAKYSKDNLKDTQYGSINGQN